MTTAPLRRQVLIAEDETMIALMLEEALRGAGFAPCGTFSTVSAALRAIEQAAVLDGAIIDMQLGRERSYPLADALTARGVPFVLVTGHSRASLPERLRDRLVIAKPCMPDVVVNELCRAMCG